MARPKFMTAGWALLSAIVATSCSDPNRVAALEKRVATLDGQVKELTASLKKIDQKQGMDDLSKTLDSVAYLTPGAQGYSVVETDLGRVTVMLEDVEPYANGARIKLRFGNLVGATINGAKAKLDWGKVDADGVPDNEHAKSREVKFDTPLRAGAWTNVPVVLEGVPPADLGFIRVREVTHTGISLAGPWAR
jgi:hypothetical protein